MKLFDALAAAGEKGILAGVREAAGVSKPRNKFQGYRLKPQIYLQPDLSGFSFYPGDLSLGFTPMRWWLSGLSG